MPVETIEGFVKLMQDFAWRFGWNYSFWCI